MNRVVDSALGVAKESVKTLTREAFHNTINTVNGISALVLEFLPGKTSFVQSLKGWELRPTLRAPRLPAWMEDGYSSLNSFIYESYSDSEYSSDEEGSESVYDDNMSAPSSPTSSMSSYHSMSSGRLSSSSSSHRSIRIDSRHPSGWWRFLMFLLWPLLFLFRRKRGPRRRQHPTSASDSPHKRSSQGFSYGDASPSMGSSLSRSDSQTSLSRQFSIASQELSKRLNDVMEYVSHLNDNRRRGILEDLQIVLELGIERIFEVVRFVVHSTLSPWKGISVLLWRFRLMLNGRTKQSEEKNGQAGTDTATLGEQQKMTLSEALNTDARSCQDIVLDAGYPFESVKVTTADGYVLTLERIPRKESRNVVLLQHGLLDTSLGWVSNGPVGSQAFAAYDQGFDVWLGNMRGYTSREHVNKRISAAQYWSYSVNEHGMLDIAAMVEYIHDTKLHELPPLASPEDPPYVLCGVSHSLGGAAFLIYVLTQRKQGKQHRFSRLVLLSPAGFHEKVPLLFTILSELLPVAEPLMRRFMPGLFIPTRGLRMIFNKLAQDFQNLPAVRALVQVFIASFVVGGDSSDWVGALRQPHYNMNDMPGLAFGVMKHMRQLKKAKRFVMYDYGAAANLKAYGQPEPWDLGANYGLIDIPVDVVMGRKDQIIPSSMVVKHFHALSKAGVRTSIKEFEFAHLDFTFAQHQELLAYVMSRLNLSRIGDFVSKKKLHLAESNMSHEQLKPFQESTTDVGEFALRKQI